MSDIQRYSISNCGEMNCDPLISDDTGDYVEYADVQDLIAENERLRTGMKGDYDLDAWLYWTAGRDQLKHDHDKWESLYRSEHATSTRLLDTLTGFRTERDQLKAENEALRAELVESRSIDVSEIKQARINVLRGLMGETSQKEFAETHSLDASYLSQLLSGHRTLGEKAAANLEKKIGLPEGALVMPCRPIIR
jgi:hypothetical protein